MKTLITAIMIALATVPGLLILAVPVSAQFKSMGTPSKGHDDSKSKKPDDGQYKSALERLPDKKFDPWANMR